MAWRRPGDKPLSEAVMVSLPTHLCVTRPQWVNGLVPPGNNLLPEPMVTPIYVMICRHYTTFYQYHFDLKCFSKIKSNILFLSLRVSCAFRFMLKYGTCLYKTQISPLVCKWHRTNSSHIEYSIFISNWYWQYKNSLWCGRIIHNRITHATLHTLQTYETCCWWYCCS